MKTKLTLILAVLAIAAAPALAAPTLKLTSSSGSWPNSPYNADVIDLSDSLWTSNGITSDFITFCVERNVTFNPGGIYYATVEDVVKYGVQSTLQDKTKQIYAAYLNGGLTAQTGNAIQYTVWESMGYSGEGKSFAFNPASFNITGWENVRVMNLWKNANLTGDVQSQLIMTSPVPAPGAILLAGIGTSLVGWLRRRKTI